jgi:hypothetical protein
MKGSGVRVPASAYERPVNRGCSWGPGSRDVPVGNRRARALLRLGRLSPRRSRAGVRRSVFPTALARAASDPATPFAAEGQAGLGRLRRAERSSVVSRCQPADRPVANVFD